MIHVTLTCISSCRSDLGSDEVARDMFQHDFSSYLIFNDMTLVLSWVQMCNTECPALLETGVIIWICFFSSWRIVYSVVGKAIVRHLLMCQDSVWLPWYSSAQRAALSTYVRGWQHEHVHFLTFLDQLLCLMTSLVKCCPRTGWNRTTLSRFFP